MVDIVHMQVGVTQLAFSGLELPHLCACDILPSFELPLTVFYFP